jgi:hypothetical protein
MMTFDLCIFPLDLSLKVLIGWHPNGLGRIFNDNLLDFVVHGINVVPLHDGGKVFHKFAFESEKKKFNQNF